MNSSELDRIATRIEDLANRALDRAGQPYYLLSQLGQDLGEDLKNIRTLTNSSLSHFVRNHLGAKFSVVLAGQFQNVQAIVRAPMTDGSSNAFLKSEMAASQIEPSVVLKDAAPSSNPRFNYRFWAAFSVPLDAQRRILNLENFMFDDGAYPEIPGGYLEIPAELIAPASAPDRDKLIMMNISKWLEKNSLPKDKFLAKPARERSVFAGSSVLDMMIAALDSKQLSSTSLSLDVVASLLRKRV